jgi:serine/threonine protein kinase
MLYHIRSLADLDRPPYVVLQEGTLHQLLYRQMVTRFHLYSNEQALDWAIQIATGIEHLHNLSPMVIHRDLKAENVMFSKEGNTRRAKLVDFGLHVVSQEP